MRKRAENYQIDRVFIFMKTFDQDELSVHALGLLYTYITFITSPEPSGSKGELIMSIPFIRPSSSVRLSTTFQEFLLQNCLAYQSQISCEASMGKGNESLFKWSMSHDPGLTSTHFTTRANLIVYVFKWGNCYKVI